MPLELCTSGPRRGVRLLPNLHTACTCTSERRSCEQTAHTSSRHGPWRAVAVSKRRKGLDGAVRRCPIARRAHRAFWKSLGQEPVEWNLAEDKDLADARHHVDVELITLRCAPFSPKNRKFPAGCEAALRELRAVIQGAHKRSSRVIIYENTAGLWRKASLRRRVEMILRKCRAHRWEAIKLSPHTHAAIPVRRMRIFYVGIKRAGA